ncbi:hypothetical protein M422DRAFT_253189 [Sphaerobolus stellatus SS14]|uniref:Secreted protein n=1 Tax=Sphaerobolus stellatus (strain SS14) TaxID=990650 RepID=A0A0C9VYP7_SPHS4|nr:hypothetical protein M422DRAFT_253189 [Sphaerobolus stellatus SS14]
MANFCWAVVAIWRFVLEPMLAIPPPPPPPNFTVATHWDMARSCTTENSHGVHNPTRCRYSKCYTGFPGGRSGRRAYHRSAVFNDGIYIPAFMTLTYLLRTRMHATIRRPPSNMSSTTIRQATFYCLHLLVSTGLGWSAIAQRHCPQRPPMACMWDTPAYIV